MKKSEVILFAAFLLVALTGCRSEAACDRLSEEQMVSELIFSRKMLDRNIYFEVDRTDSVGEKGGMLVMIVSRESQMQDSARWIELGTACDAAQVLTLYKDISERCGKDGFQVNVSVPDGKGCRKVCLRTPAGL